MYNICTTQIKLITIHQKSNLKSHKVTYRPNETDKYVGILTHTEITSLPTEILQENNIRTPKDQKNPGVLINTSLISCPWIKYDYFLCIK